VEVKAADLFQAFSEGKLPMEGGCIVTSFFQDNSAYAKYEIVAYSNAQSLFLSDEGLIFRTDGHKLFALAEPADYEHKGLEPFSRDGQRQIPHSFGEVEQFTTGSGARIMLSRQPVLAYSSFTIFRPTPLNSSVLFYNLPDVLDSIADHLRTTLSANARLPAEEAAAAARRIVAGLKQFAIWPQLAARAAALGPKKAAPRKAAARKPAAKKAAPRKPAVKKAAPKKAAARKPVRKNPARKKAAARKAARKKPAARKPAAGKLAAKKTRAKKPARRR
jgi:hypothetical protein